MVSTNDILSQSYQLIGEELNVEAVCYYICDTEKGEVKLCYDIILPGWYVTLDGVFMPVSDKFINHFKEKALQQLCQDQN